MRSAPTAGCRQGPGAAAAAAARVPGNPARQRSRTSIRSVLPVSSPTCALTLARISHRPEAPSWFRPPTLDPHLCASAGQGCQRHRGGRRVISDAPEGGGALRQPRRPRQQHGCAARADATAAAATALSSVCSALRAACRAAPTRIVLSVARFRGLPPQYLPGTGRQTRTGGPRAARNKLRLTSAQPPPQLEPPRPHSHPHTNTQGSAPGALTLLTCQSTWGLRTPSSSTQCSATCTTRQVALRLYVAARAGNRHMSYIWDNHQHDCFAASAPAIFSSYP
jgi:hypothetical protein